MELEKLYPESVVKELLRKQREIDAEIVRQKFIIASSSEYIARKILNAPSPALEGGVEFPSEKQIERILDEYVAFKTGEYVQERTFIKGFKSCLNLLLTPKEEQK